MLPVATSMIVIPSFLKTNFSLSNIGDRIAVKTIVKLLVDAIKIMLPNPRAAAFKV